MFKAIFGKSSNKFKNEDIIVDFVSGCSGLQLMKIFDNNKHFFAIEYSQEKYYKEGFSAEINDFFSKYKRVYFVGPNSVMFSQSSVECTVHDYDLKDYSIIGSSYGTELVVKNGAPSVVYIDDIYDSIEEIYSIYYYLVIDMLNFKYANQLSSLSAKELKTQLQKEEQR